MTPGLEVSTRRAPVPSRHVSDPFAGAMAYTSFEAASVSVQISRFHGRSGVDECHVLVQPGRYASLEAQLEQVSRAYREALDAEGLDESSVVFRRLFCSDLPNQTELLAESTLANPRNGDGACAVSWVGQRPLPRAKLALWACHIHDPQAALEKRLVGNALILRRGGLAHCWATGMMSPGASDTYVQTHDILERYDQLLRAHGWPLAETAIRTWLYVQHIDSNYPGLVRARREFFAGHGLTAATHYLASSGIEGVNADVHAQVSMDAYAIGGVQPAQITYLTAPDHLGPTDAYGVTFERGTAVAYQDRKHLFLSGTASIDPKGGIVHPGDVLRQLARTLENVEALLRPAGAAFRDLFGLVVYLRDAGDEVAVRQQLRERFGGMPVIIVSAPVCRPGWLVEVEGIAAVDASNPGLPKF